MGQGVFTNMIQSKRKNVFFVIALGLALQYANATQTTALGQQSPNETAVLSEEAIQELNDIMSRLLEKRVAHAVQIRAIENEAERLQKLAGFPPIEQEIKDLVTLEGKYRGKRAGLFACTHLIGNSSLGRPVQIALDKVLEHLPSYGHLSEIAFGFDRIVYLSSLKVLPALTHLIESKDTLPSVKIAARLSRARWQLNVVEQRRMMVESLEMQSTPSERLEQQKYLDDHFPNESDAQKWREQAIAELDLLAEEGADVRVVQFKAIDPKGIILVEDTSRTRESPTIAEAAKGIAFRAKHLSVGSTAPDLKLELTTGKRWQLREQKGKIVIVQFSFKGCGPCERMYPVLRQIADQFQDKVSVVSIMADAEVETTREAVKSGKMTWNVAWDGDKGPIATQWGIREFPSVFVFGTDNKLLGTGIPAEYLAEVVKALVAQNENR